MRCALLLLICGLGGFVPAVAAVAPADPIPAQPTNAATDQGPRFSVEAFDVSGNTRLSQDMIEQTVYPFLGPDRSLEDLEKARVALEEAYKKQGYESVVVELVTETAKDGSTRLKVLYGIVQLKVVEAPIGRLRVIGAKYHLPSVIKDRVPALAQGGVPDLRKVQAQLAEANKDPDLQVTPSLRAGKIPGTIDVDLKLKDTLPLHASVEFNNDHSRETSPWRVNGTVRYANLWQLGHSISFSYVVAPQNRNESETYVASYLAPIYASPWTISVSGYKSNTNVATLGGTAVLGDGYQFGARGIYKLPVSGESIHLLSFGLDYKNFQQNISIPDQANPNGPPNLLRTPVDYPALILSYAYQGSIGANPFDFTTTISLGLRGIGINENDFKNRRAGPDISEASSSFSHVNIDADYTRDLGKDWFGFIRFSGQFADGPLVSNEQFSAGGFSTVRGYFQSEVVGDDGFVGAIELRSPSLSAFIGERVGRYIDEWRLFIFADGAQIRVRKPTVGQTDSFSLLGLGFGTRFRLFKHVSGDAILGFPLQDATFSRVGDKQATFSIKAEF